MKSSLLFLCFFCLTATLFGQSFDMISEISYDNNYDQNDPFGIDSIEYVEIYLHNPQPTDPNSIKIATYDATTSNNNSTTAEVAFVRTLNDAILTWATPTGMYYVIEFPDSTFFGFPTGGIRDAQDGIALVEMGTPNVVINFWRYETCVSFTALDGPAAGSSSSPITTDFSQTCGTQWAQLVQMNSALCTCTSLQQNGFGDWELGPLTSATPPLENYSNVPVGLLYFNAEPKNERAHLSWATAQEFSNDYFSITHSTDGRSFSEIGRVQGKGDFNDESNYEFMTEELSVGQHYFKIEQYDFDGTINELPIRTVEIDDGKSISLYPSLVTNEITLANVRPGTTYQIFSMHGNLVKEDIYSSTIDASDLVRGTYVLKVKDLGFKFHKF